jgi:hypothetical protein
MADRDVDLVAAVVAVSAALSAGSVALLGFGIDSFLESASGSIAPAGRGLAVRAGHQPRVWLPRQSLMARLRAPRLTVNRMRARSASRFPLV